MQLDPQIIGVVIAILVHAAGSIWWAARMDTTLKFVKENLDKIADSMAKSEASRYSREDAARDFAVRDQQITAIWNKIENKGA
jgi:hypothetical protein